MRVFKLTKCHAGEESVKWFDNVFTMFSELLSLFEWCKNDTFIIQLVGKEEDNE